MDAARELGQDGIAARIVSMPSVELFLEQSQEYRTSVLPPGLPVVTLEAGSTTGWHRFACPSGLTIGIDHFGASAPWKVLEEQYGFTGQKVAERIRRWLRSSAGQAKKAG
jgi:transketolase